ncbi:Arsenate reductase [hydrothermal vent metagenome]|uniref:Arsenate reductase n=1 Tax=hydrothermal vent metagenome TaxID=652676 RepID=A0A1W1BSA9_9ZZZZ
MIKIYGIKNCDSVKRAIRFCKAEGIEYMLYDFKEIAVDRSTIERWIESGANIKQLFNARSSTYRNLKLKDKNLNDSEKVDWLSRENMLIKRPVVELADGRVLVGYDEVLYRKHLVDFREIQEV